MNPTKINYTVADALLLMAAGEYVRHPAAKQISCYYMEPATGKLGPFTVVAKRNGKWNVNYEKMTPIDFARRFQEPPGGWEIVRGAPEIAASIPQGAPMDLAPVTLEGMKQLLADTMERVDQMELGALAKMGERLAALEQVNEALESEPEAPTFRKLIFRIEQLEKFRESGIEWVNRIQAASTESKKRLDALEKRAAIVDGFNETTLQRFDIQSGKLSALSDDSGETIRRMQALQEKVNGIESKVNNTLPPVSALGEPDLPMLFSQRKKYAEDIETIKAALEVIAMQTRPVFVGADFASEPMQASELRCQELPPLVKVGDGVGAAWIIPEHVTAVQVEEGRMSIGEGAKVFVVVVRLGNDRLTIPYASEVNAVHTAKEIATLANEGRTI